MKTKGTSNVSFGVYRLSKPPSPNDRKVEPTDVTQTINKEKIEAGTTEQPSKERRILPDRRKLRRRADNFGTILDTRTHRDRRTHLRRESDRLIREKNSEKQSQQQEPRGIDIRI